MPRRPKSKLESLKAEYQTTRRAFSDYGYNFKWVREVDKQKALMLGVKYLSRVPLTTKAPWGYYREAPDSRMMLPIDAALQAFLHARKLLCNQKISKPSIRSVSRWLEETTGIPTTHQCLTHLLLWRYPVDEMGLPLEEREKLMYTRTDF